ncbi:hypothetical protein VPH35_015891 [Triticum aestivum]
MGRWLGPDESGRAPPSPLRSPSVPPPPVALVLLLHASSPTSSTAAAPRRGEIRSRGLAAVTSSDWTDYHSVGEITE